MTPPSVTPATHPGKPKWFDPPFYSDLVPSGSRHFPSRFFTPQRPFRQQRLREFEEPDFSAGFADYDDYNYDDLPFLDDDYNGIEPVTEPSPTEAPPPLLPVLQTAEESGDDEIGVQNNIDFSTATRNADGKLCVLKEEMVQSVVKEPILQCTQKQVEKCHYTYITKFMPVQEEVRSISVKLHRLELFFMLLQVCTETFHKNCQITFKKNASIEKIKKCYTPMQKICDGSGPEKCNTVHETSCTSRYSQKDNTTSQFIGETQCEKIPIKICGKGCRSQAAPEECHLNEVHSLTQFYYHTSFAFVSGGCCN